MKVSHLLSAMAVSIFLWVLIIRFVLYVLPL